MKAEGSDDEGGVSDEVEEREEEPDFEARKSDDDEQLVPEEKDVQVALYLLTSEG